MCKAPWLSYFFIPVKVLVLEEGINFLNCEVPIIFVVNLAILCKFVKTLVHVVVEEVVESVCVVVSGPTPHIIEADVEGTLSICTILHTVVHLIAELVHRGDPIVPEVRESVAEAEAFQVELAITAYRVVRLTEKSGLISELAG